MSEKCNSMYGDVKCSLDNGHDGPHYACWAVPNERKPNEKALIPTSHFRIEEWNDKGETPDFTEYGAEFPCEYTKGEDERRKIMSIAIADAKATLPSGTVFEVRAKEYPKEQKTTFYNRVAVPVEEQEKDWGIAWYYVPDQPEGF